MLNFLFSCAAQAPVTMVARGCRAPATAPWGSLGTTVSSRRSGARMGVNGMASSVTALAPSTAPVASLWWTRWIWVSCQDPAVCTFSGERPLTLPGSSPMVCLPALRSFCLIPPSLPSLQCFPLPHVLPPFHPHLQEVVGITLLLVVSFSVWASRSCTSF